MWMYHALHGMQRSLRIEIEKAFSHIENVVGNLWFN